MGKLFYVQTDLFVVQRRTPQLAGVERQRAVALLRVLLTEALTKPESPPLTSSEEGRGDE